MLLEDTGGQPAQGGAPGGQGAGQPGQGGDNSQAGNS